MTLFNQIENMPLAYKRSAQIEIFFGCKSLWAGLACVQAMISLDRYMESNSCLSMSSWFVENRVLGYVNDNLGFCCYKMHFFLGGWLGFFLCVCVQGGWVGFVMWLYACHIYASRIAIWCATSNMEVSFPSYRLITAPCYFWGLFFFYQNSWNYCLDNFKILRYDGIPECTLVLEHPEIPQKSKGAVIHEFPKAI